MPEPRKRQKRKILMIRDAYYENAIFYNQNTKGKHHIIGRIGSVNVADTFADLLRNLGYRVDIVELPKSAELTKQLSLVSEEKG